MRGAVHLRGLFPCFVLIFVIFPLIRPGDPLPVMAETNALGDPCHIAITVPRDLSGYDLSEIGVSSYLDWTSTGSAGVASNIEHIKVVRVRDDLYASQLAGLSTWVPQYPGAVWIIGNEPDAWAQDNIYAEVYADRYLQMADAIHTLDPSARVGFAPVVQPSPLRMKYLDRIFDRLIVQTGSSSAALSKIDIFTIHAFILNEQPGGNWGAGIPPDFPDNDPDAFVIDAATELYKTHDITIFRGWVTAFRQWMKLNEAQGKPLWITEYGSLIPPLDPRGIDYYNVTDEDTRDYMLATFDFVYTTGIDPIFGYQEDGNRLVQRAYWYSLNDHRWAYGGSLFDPYSLLHTIVGDAFVAYDPPVSQVSHDPYPVGVSFIPLDYTPGSGKTRVDYRVEVRVGNTVTAERLAPVMVHLTLDGVPLGSQAGNLPRCGGVVVFSYDWPDIDPSDIHSAHATVDPGSGLVDTNLNNNTLDLISTLRLPSKLFLPKIQF